MSLESEIFKRCIVDFSTLLPYGFKKINDIYLYQTKLKNQDFLCKIFIKENGFLYGQIIEVDTNEEYINFRISTNHGSFVNSIREQYIEILQNIKDNCFKTMPFISLQANNITSFIKENFSIDPQFVFKNSPSIGVFKNDLNNKWFGLIMPIEHNKLDINKTGEIEILNIKCPNSKEIIDNISIFPAYHMNKDSWISIILDNSIDTNYIFELVEKSYEYFNKPKGFLIPANPKVWDVMSMFMESDVSYWPQKVKASVGDLLFFYVSVPYSSIMFKCQVVETDICYGQNDSGTRNVYLMKIKLLKQYEKSQYSLDWLKKHGVSGIRSSHAIADEVICLFE